MSDITFAMVEDNFEKDKIIKSENLDFCVETMGYNSQSSKKRILKFLKGLGERLENEELFLDNDKTVFTRKYFANYISENYSDYVFNHVFEEDN